MPREKAAILSKTNSTSAASVNADIDRFRRELGVDYIDILFLHKIKPGRLERADEGPIQVVSEAVDRGIIRSHRGERAVGRN